MQAPDHGSAHPHQPVPAVGGLLHAANRHMIDVQQQGSGEYRLGLLRFG
jgi:hypothetical protein